MKRIIALLLVLAALFTLFTGCFKPFANDNSTETTVSPHHLLHTLKDGGTTYYCWDDGVATMTDTYDASSVLYWENDVDSGTYYVKNSKGTVAMEQYAVVTEAPIEIETVTETVTEYDPNQGHTLVGIVTDTNTGHTYYCWDNGTATMSEEYSASGLTWTHPWNEKFYNIYNGSSDNGNVIYSEKTCSWCGNHKTYYLSYLRNPDLSEERLYLCESCHINLQSYCIKCPICGYYYDKDYAVYVNGSWYCRKCHRS